MFSDVITIKCRQVVAGCTEGEAIVSTDAIAGWRSIDESDGRIVERNHCLFNKSIKDKILVFPVAKGSSGWSGTFHALALNGVAPRGMLVSYISAKSALGAVLVGCPTTTDFEQDPLKIIETGDWVKVDADAGLITVYKP